MKTLTTFLALFLFSAVQAQASLTDVIETSLHDDHITALYSTVFIKQTSTNGKLFLPVQNDDIRVQTRLVIVTETDYIVTNPFVLSTEFAIPEVSDLDALLVTSDMFIFPFED